MSTDFIVFFSGLFLTLCLAAFGYFDFGYRAYLGAFLRYKYQVRRGRITYDQFKAQIAARKSLGLALGADAQNDRQELLNDLNRLLEQNPDTVRQYFSAKWFWYQKQYKDMRAEASRGSASDVSMKQPKKPIEQLATFSDLITISDAAKKEQVLANIGTYLISTNKGKGLALLIDTLRELGYLATSTKVAPLLRMMTKHYNITFGSTQGVNAFIGTFTSGKSKGSTIENMKTLIKKNIQA